MKLWNNSVYYFYVWHCVRMLVYVSFYAYSESRCCTEVAIIILQIVLSISRKYFPVRVNFTV